MTEYHFQTRAKQTLKQPLLSPLQTKILLPDSPTMHVTHSTNLTLLGFQCPSISWRVQIMKFLII